MKPREEIIGQASLGSFLAPIFLFREISRNQILAESIIPIEFQNDPPYKAPAKTGAFLFFQKKGSDSPPIVPASWKVPFFAVGKLAIYFFYIARRSSYNPPLANFS